MCFTVIVVGNIKSIEFEDSTLLGLNPVMLTSGPF